MYNLNVANFVLVNDMEIPFGGGYSLIFTTEGTKLQRFKELHKPIEDTELVCIATLLPSKNLWTDILLTCETLFHLIPVLNKIPGLIRYAILADFRNHNLYTISIWQDWKSAVTYRNCKEHLKAIDSFEDLARAGGSVVEWKSKEAPLDWTNTFKRLEHPTFVHPLHPPHRDIP